MRKKYNKWGSFFYNKKGASNLEAIILMVVALVVGSALMKFGSSVKDTVDKGTKRVNEIGDNL